MNFHDLLRGGSEEIPSVEQLDELQATLQQELLGADASLADASLNATDPAVVRLIDALRAMAMVAPDDSAHPWALAAALHASGLHGDAASAFLEAERRFLAEALRGDGVSGDEQDWASSARYLACRCLVEAGSLLSAWIASARLDAPDRAEVRARILDAVADSG